MLPSFGRRGCPVLCPSLLFGIEINFVMPNADTYVTLFAIYLQIFVG